MTPHKQLYRHNPEAGVFGDCCRTVYACLLDKDPSEVPHFAEAYWDDTAAWARAEDEYLEAQGVRLIRIAYDASTTSLQKVHDWARYYLPGLYYILHGTSGNGVGHVVICCDGEIVHDPSQDSSGIVGPIEGYYWIYLFADSRFARGGAA